MLIAGTDDPHDPTQNIHSPILHPVKQRKKRRSAAERRASHRRRSSLNEQQIKQICNESQQLRRSSEQHESHDDQQIEYDEGRPTFSPIPDESEPPEEFPPEPETFPPGELIDCEWDPNSDASNTADIPFIQKGYSPSINGQMVVGLGLTPATPVHQRSASDHVLHNEQSVRLRQRELVSPDPDSEEITKLQFSPKNGMTSDVEQQNNNHRHKEESSTGGDEQQLQLLPTSLIEKTMLAQIRNPKKIKDGGWSSTEQNSTNNTEYAPPSASQNEKVKNRTAKANSMILNIWSIRQRRKKDSPPHRSLANFWAADKSHDNKLHNDNGRMQSMDSAMADLQSPLSPQFPVTSPFSASPPTIRPEDFTTDTSSPLFFNPQLVQAQWKDLDLWSAEAASWAVKYPEESSRLNAAELKRQNVIYELILTEKHHCQVLILLKQLYREGIFRNRLLPLEQLKLLIPDVIDSLLSFHLSLLRRMVERASKCAIIEEIGDILLDEFESGQHRSTAIQAYTSFCLGREDSNRQFNSLMAQNQEFRKFIEFHQSGHKDRSFKDCILLIAQRLTKYPVLVEQIAKLESEPVKRQVAEEAHSAVRTFAMQVDQELHRHELERHWNGLKKALDKSVSAKLIHPKEGQEFSVDDLVMPLESGHRRLLLATKVFWRETMNGSDMELGLLLCNDAIVFTRPKNGSISNGNATKLPQQQLFRHSAHAGVLPLQSVLVRGQNPRRKSLLLIVTAKQRPDLFELAFPTCAELEYCAQAIKKAKLDAPNYVHLAKDAIFSLDDGTMPIREEAKREEVEFHAKMDQWKNELTKLFEKRIADESQLEQYFEGRMEWMDRVREQLEKVPQQRRTKKDVPKEDAASNQQIRDFLKTKFTHLDEVRKGPLVRLIERAQRVKDADLLALFDDLHDLGEKGGKGAAAADTSSTDEQPRASDSSEERRRPRRVSTYHGIVDQQQKAENSAGSSTSGGCAAASGIRRHATVPAGSRTAGGGGSSSAEEEERDEMSRLPIRMGPSQRRAAAELIRENVRLRVENNRLKVKAALQEMHFSALKTRGASTNAMREDDEEEMPRQILEQMARDLARREIEMERREAEMKLREEKLQMSATNQRMQHNRVASLPLEETPNSAAEYQKETSSPANMSNPSGN